jgi:hypothetical protein
LLNRLVALLEHFLNDKLIPSGCSLNLFMETQEGKELLPQK